MPETDKTQSTPRQEEELIYALDIGTRSVIGMVGSVEGERVHIRAVEKRLHTRRVMMDGQIEDIAQVAAAVGEVTRRLEQAVGCRLSRACVAAAGRALRTERGHSQTELASPEPVSRQMIAQLEAAAVAEAEQALQTEDSGGQKMLLVGYTATRYTLDGYPLTTLLGHTGRILEADVVATFLPSGVIDSLYAVLRQAGLEVASLTLEPIAALNAAIPVQLRLLNLCLVDIGAGTSDIAICRDGSVVGYTMATVAGDEMTEALMREYLVDYDTAERIKAGLAEGADIHFTNILGLEQTCSVQEAETVLSPAIDLLTREIAQRVLEINGVAPSALFLAGGGSKLPALGEKVAAALEMDPKRVAVAGGHFKSTVWSDALSLEDPEYTTPLGIAVSAGLGLISDSCQVLLNGAPAKLFRSGSLTAMELLMMNGYTYSDLLGRSGKPLIVQVDGRRTVFHGEPAQPAELRINGAEAQPTAIVRAGDQITFTPAQAGRDCRITAAELTRRLRASAIMIDGRTPEPEEEISTGAFVTVAVPVRPAEPDKPSPTQTVEQEQAAAPQETPQAAAAAPRPASSVILNGQGILLPAKPDGAPYYVMDLLERTGIDFKHVDRPVRLRVNGAECLFQQVLKDGDQVEIGYENETVEQ